MNIRTLVICASLFAAPVYADLATGILLGQALANTQNCNSSPIINNVENNGFISLPSSMIVQTGLHYYTCPTYPGYTAQSIYHNPDANDIEKAFCSYLKESGIGMAKRKKLIPVEAYVASQSNQPAKIVNVIEQGGKINLYYRFIESTKGVSTHE